MPSILQRKPQPPRLGKLPGDIGGSVFERRLDQFSSGGIIERLPIESPSTARDLSDTGLVLGVIQGPWVRAKSYVYGLDTGVLRLYEPLEDDLSVVLQHLNPSGTVAVGWGVKRDLRQRMLVAFLDEGRLLDLSAMVELPAGWYLSRVASVNVSGQILAGVESDSPEHCRNVILTPQ